MLEAISNYYLIGWCGNIFLIIGLLGAGKKYKHAFGITLVGELAWLGESLRMNRVDMIFLCVVFSMLACLNWYWWTHGQETL